MDILTYTNLVPMDWNLRALDTTAVTYIQSLIEPLDRELADLHSLDELEIWAHMSLPRDLVTDWTQCTFAWRVFDKSCWSRGSPLEAAKARLIYTLGIYLTEAARDYMEMERIPGPILPAHVAQGARRYTFSLDPCLAHYLKIDPSLL